VVGERFERFRARHVNQTTGQPSPVLDDFIERVAAVRAESKVGGFPSWYQHPRYPTCACGRRLEFVFELTSEPEAGLDIVGDHYFFACPTCGPRAMTVASQTG
jgi:hypothetical protein